MRSIFLYRYSLTERLYWYPATAARVAMRLLDGFIVSIALKLDQP